MEPIGYGQSGPAVEDVQGRLRQLDYSIDEGELAQSSFGPTTLAAVRAFRSACDLPSGDVIDEDAWKRLVDATYQMGDRTLYLRAPYLHGADVSHLQMTLNVLGFSCGEVDGYYGPHTEAAVREFQANSGIFPDGMAFQDTFEAIERLHHVWLGKTAPASANVAHFGLSRAAEVLESTHIVAAGTDPISRSVVSRMWNIALATTSDARFVLLDSVTHADPGQLIGADVVLEVTTQPVTEAAQLPEGCIYVTSTDLTELGQRVISAVRASVGGPYRMRVELAGLNSYDGSVTSHDVQSAAITLLDALCAALDERGVAGSDRP